MMSNDECYRDRQEEEDDDDERRHYRFEAGILEDETTELYHYPHAHHYPQHDHYSFLESPLASTKESCNSSQVILEEMQRLEIEIRTERLVFQRELRQRQDTMSRFVTLFSQHHLWMVEKYKQMMDRSNEDQEIVLQRLQSGYYCYGMTIVAYIITLVCFILILTLW